MNEEKEQYQTNTEHSASSSKQWIDYRGRIVCTVLALLLGVIFLLWGFGEALVVAIFLAAGYLIGRQLDGHKDLQIATRKTMEFLTARR